MYKSLSKCNWRVALVSAGLALTVAACGAAATPTPVPPPPTKAVVAPAATATKASAAAPTAAPPASSVSFSKDILPLLQKNCTRCHGGSNPRVGLSLDSYQNVLKGSSRLAITPGAPESSPLYNLVKSGAMPYGGTKLADADILKIFDWIKAGAANN